MNGREKDMKVQTQCCFGNRPNGSNVGIAAKMQSLDGMNVGGLSVKGRGAAWQHAGRQMDLAES